MKELTKERTQLFTDLMDGKIPKKVPIGIKLYPEFFIEYGKGDLKELQWNTENLETVIDKLCQDFISDVPPFGANRFISYYQILEARTIVMGSDGVMQHPEVEGLLPEEYDAFIKAPYDFMIETVLPRLYPGLDTDANMRAMTFAKAMKAYFDEFANFGKIKGKMIEKYGYAVDPPNSFAFCEAPFDFVADFLRGFKGISKDLRRCPQQVLEAVEAVASIMTKLGTPANPSRYGQTMMPLHMAPYMRTKDFEKFYWPTFKTMLESFAKAGQGMYLFIEHDWMRYLDYLSELPENIRMRFEYGDPQLVKDKLGKKHILSGFYPVSLLKTGTRQECIDKAKELIDILAPGGRYYFDFDKVPITVNSINVDNLRAVLEFVNDYGKY
ncbi:MAG: uroporphyrinogen decarboxylase family protein [Eubacteriales bacterium]